MILILSGYPFAGKTTVLNQLLNKIGIEYVVIDPKQYYPDNFDELDSECRMNVAINSWELSCKRFKKDIKKYDNDVLLIHDTCASSLRYLWDMTLFAKKNDHKVIFMFVYAPLNICRDRSNGKIDTNTLKRYSKKFKDTLPEMKEKADVFTTIDNINGTIDFKKVIKVIHGRED